MTRYLSPADVCELVPGLTVRMLQRLRDEGRGPRYSKPTFTVIIYLEQDVRAWIAGATVRTRDQP